MSMMMKGFVEKLVETHGRGAEFAQALGEGGGFHLKVERFPHMPLVVEVVYGGRVSVLHYYTQMGDTMYDPEIVFEVARGGRWRPVEYTQHNMGVYENYEGGKAPRSLQTFCRQWARNLQTQGFLDPTRVTVSSLSHPFEEVAEVTHA